MFHVTVYSRPRYGKIRNPDVWVKTIRIEVKIKKPRSNFVRLLNEFSLSGG